MDRESVIAKVNIIDRASLNYPIIIGKKDLKKFLVEIR
jgi:hypothetical protein